MKSLIVCISCCIFVSLFTGCETEDSFLNNIEETTAESELTRWREEQNLWMYEMMKHHYYWTAEIPDSNLLSFGIEPSKFFLTLKSSQDRFSWYEANVNYNGIYTKLVEGLEFETYQVCGSMVSRILYVSSPYLIERGLKRGDFVKIIVCKLGHLLEKGIIKNGEFVITDRIFVSPILLRNRNIAPTVSLDSIYIINNKRIGYFVYNQFESSTDVAQIAIRLKNLGIDELILDLRYNPGGYVSTSNYLASMLAPTEQLGSLYQLQRFNDKVTKEKQKNGGSGIDSVFLNKGSITVQRNLDLSRLVVLTTKNTASASESLIIGLRPYMKVVTIGTTTCGKDVGSYTIADNNYKYQLQPITFKYYNANNESTPTTGIVPDIYVEDDLDHQRGDTNEALLKAAIEYLTGEIQIGAVKDRSVSQPKMKEVGRSSIEIKNNL